jgi:hypothetical protein
MRGVAAATVYYMYQQHSLAVSNLWDLINFKLTVKADGDENL